MSELSLHNRTFKISHLAVLLGIESVVLVLSGFLSVYLPLVFTALVLALVAVFYVRFTQYNLIAAFFVLIPLLLLLPPRVNSFISLFGVVFFIMYWLYDRAKNRFNFEPLPAYINYFIVSYLFVCTLATFHSVAFGKSLVELFRLYFILIFIQVVFNAVRDKKAMNGMLNILFYSAVLISLISLPAILSFSPADIVSGDLIKIRLTSYFENANTMSMPFMLVVPILFVRIFYPRSDKRKSQKWIYVLFLMFFLYIILLTNSRSALLFVLSAFFILMLGLKFGRLIIMSGLAILIAILPFIGKTLFLLFRLERGLTGRDVLWKASIDMIRDHPWLGIGLANYEAIKYKYIIPTDFFSEFTRSTEMSGAAHNLVLTIAVENGIIAGLIMLLFLFTLFYKCFRLIRSTRDEEYRILLYTATSMIFGLAIRGFFESGIIVGSARINDFFYFLIPLVIIARTEMNMQDKAG